MNFTKHDLIALVFWLRSMKTYTSTSKCVFAGRWFYVSVVP